MGLRIHILAVESSLEAQAIRSAAEYWGAAVSVTWAGNALDLTRFLASRPEHELIVLAGHGDERGLLLPALDESVRANYPFGEVIRPADFRTFLALRNNVVLNTSCCGFVLAQAFQDGGAGAYIGANGYPDGNAALFYALGFVYQFAACGHDAAEAHRRSVSAEDDRRLFALAASRL